MTAQEIFHIRHRQHLMDAELLAALEATLKDLQKVTEERNKLAAEVERLKAPKEKE